MRKGMVTSFIAVAFLVLSLSVAQADVPGQINYQGYLTDDVELPIDADMDMLFSIYDAEIGGTEVWSEGPTTVHVKAGVYNVILGWSSPLAPADLDGPRWLEVIVEGEYLAPRDRIVSVLFAIEAGNADTVDGVDAADLEESAEIDADVAAHAADASSHHSRYTDAEAVSATAAAGMEESAEIDSDVAAHSAAASAHHAKTTSFTELIDTAADAQIPDDITVNYATAAGNADTVDGQDSSEFAAAGHDHDGRYYSQTTVDALEARIAALEALFAGVTRAGDDITISGANVHIVSGSGTTDGAVNGLGNLIVGYNELRGSSDDRTGSHNIVVGKEQNYSSYGGLVAGLFNTISGPYASVSGGYYNEATGDSSSVSGGWDNVASNLYSSVSGGSFNEASGDYSSVSGGWFNVASDYGSSVSGGNQNTASGNYSSVSGGIMNTASGSSSSVSGGGQNYAGG